MLKPSPSDNLTIIIEPSSGIMRVTWARPLLTAGLIDSYYELLDTAVHANCRFWHFDLRMRIRPAATFTHWFVDTFAPLAIQRLGAPIYMACWLGGRHASYTGPLTTDMQEQVGKIGVYPAFFEKEPEARAWLLRKQSDEMTGNQRAQ